MNLDSSKTKNKNESEELLNSMANSSANLMEQIQTRQKGKVKFRLIQSRGTFYSTPLNDLGPDGTWLIGLTSFEL